MANKILKTDINNLKSTMTSQATTANKASSITFSGYDDTTKINKANMLLLQSACNKLETLFSGNCCQSNCNQNNQENQKCENIQCQSSKNQSNQIDQSCQSSVNQSQCTNGNQSNQRCMCMCMCGH